MLERKTLRLLHTSLVRNLGNVISNDIIAKELDDFLAHEFPRTRGDSLLDLGAGTRPYLELYQDRFANHTSLDVVHSEHDISAVDVIASADMLPFVDESFDCVICTEMLEHCPDPVAVLAEIRRVLKPGGACFLTTPFMRPLHEMPHDFYRFTPPALRYLAEKVGLRVVSLRPRGDYGAVALLTLQLPLTKVWQQAARRTRLLPYRWWNPPLLFSLVIPQLIYLAYWHVATQAKAPGLARLSRKLSHYTLGYITILKRGEDEEREPPPSAFH